MKATYIDHMGTDLSVVNAARVSFGKKSEWVREEYTQWEDCVLTGGREWPMVRKVLSKGDKGLIQFLARGCTSGDWELLADMVNFSENFQNYEEIREFLNHIRRMPPHWTPFGHTAISLHIKAPIFVTRQLNKHQVGFVINEVSRRYVTDEPEFYVPEVWRKAAANVKQGSSDEAVNPYGATGHHPADYMDECKWYYTEMINAGVCPEQARMVLPQSMYTEFQMTGNLYGWANLFNQRTDSHAQREVQEIAHQIGAIIEPLFPESWKALTN